MLINRIIPPRDYELIRDQIGAILALELLGQASMTYNELFEAPVYIQRSKPVNPDECPMINVMIDDGTFDSQDVLSSRGQYNLFIDVYVNLPSTPTGKGDQLSAYEAQKLAGVCQAILEDPQYNLLGFTPPFIGRSHVTNFSTGTVERGESTNLSVVRITMTAMSNQKEPGITAAPLISATTNMHLNNSPNGLVFIFNA